LGDDFGVEATEIDGERGARQRPCQRNFAWSSGFDRHGNPPSCDGGPDLAPAHSSSTFAIEVKSDEAPYLALVMASICRTTEPQTIGTPMASASSTQSRTSL